MSYEIIYTVEDEGDWGALIVAETRHQVIQLKSLDAAIFYTDLMNEVYNQVKKDVESGRIKLKET